MANYSVTNSPITSWPMTNRYVKNRLTPTQAQPLLFLANPKTQDLRDIKPPHITLQCQEQCAYTFARGQNTQGLPQNSPTIFFLFV